MDISEIAGLASNRSYALGSAFGPTYNMTANLLSRMSPADAAKVLETSFAQFQADKAVVGLARKVRKNEATIAAYEKSMHCDRGDFGEYAALRREISETEKQETRTKSKVKRAEIVESLSALKIGDVITPARAAGRGHCCDHRPDDEPRRRLPAPDRAHRAGQGVASASPRGHRAGGPDGTDPGAEEVQPPSGLRPSGGCWASSPRRSPMAASIGTCVGCPTARPAG